MPIPNRGGLQTVPLRKMQPNAPALISWPLEDEEFLAANAPSGTNHLHWTIQAFHHIEEAAGGLADVVTIHVEAASERDALARAMTIIQRANYRIAAVDEVCKMALK